MIEIEKIKTLSHELFSEVRDIRRAIHSHPELSFKEFDTSRLIAQTLDRWGIKHVDGIVGTGIIATIEGRNPEKGGVALRADMDALPVSEENDIPYKSKNEGVMHACGHDAHVAMLLGAAKILNELKTDFEGTVKLIFQPGEEMLPGGAKLMIEQGVLEGVDAIIAQHCYPDLPCGEIGLCAGPYMASGNEIELTLTGKGGHAAKPQQSQDMVWIAADMIAELQKKVWKLCSGKEGCVLRFGQFAANGTYNVIPDSISIKGTLRTYNEDLRGQIVQLIDEHIHDKARAANVKAELDIRQGYPVLVNDVALKNAVKGLASSYIGAENVKELQPLYTSEDFAWYSQQVPALFFRLGTSNPAKGIIGKQHTSTFDIDEDAMEIGMGLIAFIASRQ